MHSLIVQGKVLHWGTSKWPAGLVAEAHDFALSNHLMARPSSSLSTPGRLPELWRNIYQT